MTKQRSRLCYNDEVAVDLLDVLKFAFGGRVAVSIFNHHGTRIPHEADDSSLLTAFEAVWISRDNFASQVEMCIDFGAFDWLLLIYILHCKYFIASVVPFQDSNICYLSYLSKDRHK